MNRKNLEASFAEVTDMVQYKDLQNVLCDFSLVEEISLTEHDIAEISSALLHVFLTRKELRLIDIADDSHVMKILSMFNEPLIELGVSNLSFARNLEEAVKQLH